MPNQSSVEATILNARYKLATLANTNLNLILNGGEPNNTQYLNWFNLNLQGLIYQDINKDYASSTTNTLYTRLNGFIGIPAGAEIDPNFQAPGTTIVVEISGGAINYNYTEANLVDAGGGNYYLPFMLDSKYVPVSLTINGVSTAFTFDETTVPPRIYGFANNLTQAIVLTVISSTTGVTPPVTYPYIFTSQFTNQFT